MCDVRPMRLVILADAAKFMRRRMPAANAVALTRRLMAFAEDPDGDHGFARPLSGWDGAVRIRHGDWRAICRIRRAELLVEVVRVGHRSEVYR